ncbi:GNAT family N-acetyltransferase [Alicyclobacillus macrosporangiidus]|uniref:GNAT family N-acetyltransferase n=1 Tax=Alicyclobacillus macrosporangiidus TaxID=392015 RepID=UPI000A830A28|nr:GNAT family N-acetyltransferase [Alicyclobacillus macrosporangiidus]
MQVHRTDPQPDRPLVWRRLHAQDVESWVDLLHRAYAANLAAGFNFSAAALTLAEALPCLNHQQVYGGEQDGRLCATFTLRQDEDGWHLSFYAVDPRLQRQGIGRLTMRRAEETARAIGVTTLLLDTPENHPWLVSYYLREGYEVYGRTHWPGKRYHSLLFRKRLTEGHLPQA